MCRRRPQERGNLKQMLQLPEKNSRSKKKTGIFQKKIRKDECCRSTETGKGGGCKSDVRNTHGVSNVQRDGDEFTKTAGSL